ncbi:hypothetical protein BQ8482_290040 [Mesorhizobium delmotii]|uniref:Uncharacterized protein n=1 Tax=Mesorhizobium delmotii TaxID=1631247 RepID=A0A2P9AMR3_9HYPH|nr:hypothetical protein BQ8482_290040 [Mesorhizobium delmotii]
MAEVFGDVPFECLSYAMRARTSQPQPNSTRSTHQARAEALCQPSVLFVVAGVNRTAATGAERRADTI